MAIVTLAVYSAHLRTLLEAWLSRASETEAGALLCALASQAEDGSEAEEAVELLANYVWETVRGRPHGHGVSHVLYGGARVARGDAPRRQRSALI